MTVREWTADPEQALDIPAALRASMRWRFTIATPVQVTGECAEFIQHAAGVQLKGCLCDCSDTMRGTLLKKRVTWRDEIWCFHVPVLIVAKCADEPSWR